MWVPLWCVPGLVVPQARVPSSPRRTSAGTQWATLTKRLTMPGCCSAHPVSPSCAPPPSPPPFGSRVGAWCACCGARGLRNYDRGTTVFGAAFCTRRRQDARGEGGHWRPKSSQWAGWRMGIGAPGNRGCARSWAALCTSRARVRARAREGDVGGGGGHCGELEPAVTNPDGNVGASEGGTPGPSNRVHPFRSATRWGSGNRDGHMHARAGAFPALRCPGGGGLRVSNWGGG
jgi:hypothetical protein